MGEKQKHAKLLTFREQGDERALQVTSQRDMPVWYMFLCMYDHRLLPERTAAVGEYQNVLERSRVVAVNHQPTNPSIGLGRPQA